MTISGAFEVHAAGELATYRGYLDGHRRTLETKCADLTAEQLATPGVPPSDLSLLGLVRHLGRVEHYWFRMVIDEHLEETRLDADDPTGGFHSVAPTAESVAEAFARWDEQAAYADACLAQLTDADLDAPRLDRHGAQLTVREVLVHLIEEYARHNGHADLLRERLDAGAGR